MNEDTPKDGECQGCYEVYQAKIENLNEALALEKKRYAELEGEVKGLVETVKNELIEDGTCFCKYHAEAKGVLSGLAQGRKELAAEREGADALREALNMLCEHEGLYHVKGTGETCRHCIDLWPCRFGQAKEFLAKHKERRR